MSELSPKAKALMRQASRGGGPTDPQRRALKVAVLGSTASAVAAAATTKVLLSLLVAVVGGGVLVATRAGHPSSPELPDETAAPAAVPPPVARTAKPVQVSVARTNAQPAPNNQPKRDVKPTVPVELAPTPVPTSLALELDALERAVVAVEAKRFDEGLRLARAFLKDFPASEFVIEARVVEVLALCGVSRVDEARRAAGQLPSGASENPAVRRLDDSCAEQFVP